MSFLSILFQKLSEYYERAKSQIGLFVRDLRVYLLECKMVIFGAFAYLKETASIVSDKLYYGFRWLRHKYYRVKQNERLRNICSFLFAETLPYILVYGVAIAFLASQFFGFAFSAGNVFGMGVAYYFVDNEIPGIVSRLVPWPTREQVEG